jgi:peptide/nickel transport system permease protein
MARFVIRRLFSMLVVLFMLSVLTFLIFQVIPNGNPALRLAGRTATPQTIAAITRTWGFNRPIWSQYLITMHKIFTGTVISYNQQLNVLSQIKAGLPATLSLAIGAGIIWLSFGILLGLLSALKAGKFVDRVLAILALAGISTPSFVIGAVLLYVLAYRTHVFPNTGYVSISDPVGWFDHLVLPWITLAILFIGFYSRVLRSNILDTINDDYVRTAWAKGLSRRRVIVHHVLRNSLIPIVSLFGLDFAAVVGGGTILVETVFNLNGVGQYAEQSIAALDVPPVLVITMLGGFAVVIFAALVDILYAVLDPRIRLTA